MGKWYAVEVKQVLRYLIEVEDYECENEAVDYVLDQRHYDGNWDEVEGNEIDQEDLESFLRHTDRDNVFSL